MSARPKLPATVLSGFLGSGKTTLLQHLLKQAQGLRIALIVNDMSEINLDAELVREGHALEQHESKLVELTNGCICCTLREDLMVEVRRLAESGSFDHLIIESTGVSEPLPVATSFSYRDAESGLSLEDVAYIDTMVSLVDCENFLDYPRGEDALSLVSLVSEQVEMADVIVLNKVDRVSPETLGRVRHLVRTLNPTAHLLETSFSQVELKEVVGSRRFNLEKARQMSGWYQELDGKHHQPETLEFGIASHVYRARKPFDPERLQQLFQEPWPGLLRSKGFAWLADSPGIRFWSSALNQFTLNPAGSWWAEVPRARWPQQGTPGWDWIQQRWQEPDGDRRQEIVFIGQNLDPLALDIRLDRCLAGAR